MNRNWTPKSHVSVTDAGVVIEVELGGIRREALIITFEASQLCIRGQRDDLGSFETRFDVPSGYSPVSARASFTNGILRIDMPPNNDSFGFNFPRTMMIYCNECGKHFDIVLTSKDSKNYRCPACGKVHVFDLEAFVNKAIEQGKKMLKKSADADRYFVVGDTRAMSPNKSRGCVKTPTRCE
jgi:hypothetical protein